MREGKVLGVVEGIYSERRYMKKWGKPGKCKRIGRRVREGV